MTHTTDRDPATILPLELNQVQLVAGNKRVIKDMSFTLEAGKRTFVLGPNGAGKSLLLRLCHGLLRPSDGRIIWHGPTSLENPADRANRITLRQAMVFQRPIMLRRSVAANLAYALRVRNVPRAERQQRIIEVLTRTGLRGRAERPARTLSFGEQQRLALARVWALRPEVLFLDEPSASLDPAATHAIEEIITAIATEGTKIVMTTHDLSQARRMADEILFLHRGRLLEKAPAAQFFERPENDLARAFLSGELLWWRKRPPHDGTEAEQNSTKHHKS